MPSNQNDNFGSSLENTSSRQPAVDGQHLPSEDGHPSRNGFDPQLQPQRKRGSSLVQSFAKGNLPLGMWQATGELGSRIPRLSEIHDGSFGDNGWSREGQIQHRSTEREDTSQTESQNRNTSPSSSGIIAETKAVKVEFIDSHEIRIEQQAINEVLPREHGRSHNLSHSLHKASGIFYITDLGESHLGPDETGSYPNGYRFPKKHTWSQSVRIGLKGFWKFLITPMGFAITIYGLNVVAWGAMIFFILLNAAPAMCHPSCNDDFSSRKVWIEIDAQILTALFCVTAFGLMPWRTRDFYCLMQWRLGGNRKYQRKLAGVYRKWYRLPGSNRLSGDIGPCLTSKTARSKSENLFQPSSDPEIRELEQNLAVPLPITSIPDLPLTGVRAEPTRSWTLDIVIYMYMSNTLIQIPLCGIMWGMNRFNRPSWATGFLISIGCLTGIVAGVVVYIESSKIKKLEGVPIKEYDVIESAEEYRERKVKENARQAKKNCLYHEG